LTKHDPVDGGLKGPLSIDETSRVDLTVNDLVAENVAKLYTQRVFVEETPKIKAVRVKKAHVAKRSRLCRITQRLYNLESGNDEEKPLHLELDLYQMETY
jgi:hypothetical protein